MAKFRLTAEEASEVQKRLIELNTRMVKEILQGDLTHPFATKAAEATSAAAAAIAWLLEPEADDHEMAAPGRAMMESMYGAAVGQRKIGR